MLGSAGPHDAHDRLFKYACAPPEAMGVLVRRMLPAEMLAHLDSLSLRPAPTERTNPRLGSRAVDLHFTVDYVEDGRSTELHLVVEHRSTPDPTEARLATLALLIRTVLDQGEPAASEDLRTLWRLVDACFDARSPARTLIVDAVNERANERFASIVAGSVIALGPH